MFYYLYEIRNNVNGKIYLGVHKTKDINDGYMGSGKVIRYAIEKYGIENFTKVILEQFDSSEKMFAREKEVITEEFLKRNDVYNLRRGGYGGFDYLNDNSEAHSKRAKKGYAKSLKNMNLSDLGKKGNRIQREKKIGIYSDSFISTFANNREIQQLGNLPEARKKAIVTQRETFKRIGHAQGEKNSQFGSLWITNGTENAKVKSIDEIPDGWRKGRVISKV